MKKDFPKEIVDARRILLPIFRTAKKSKQNVKLSVDHLILDGKVYTLNNLDQTPLELRQTSVFTPIVSESVQAFSHKQSPLSIFYGAKTVIDVKTFHCNELYLFYTKADIAGDQVAKKKNLNATSPEECKRRGGQINLNIETWKATSHKVMYDGCYAKFKQNTEQKKFLLDTGDRTLVEASKTDLYWGAGLSLWQHKELATVAGWPGKNECGNILMEVCGALKQETL